MEVFEEGFGVGHWQGAYLPLQSSDGGDATPSSNDSFQCPSRISASSMVKSMGYHRSKCNALEGKLIRSN